MRHDPPPQGRACPEPVEGGTIRKMVAGRARMLCGVEWPSWKPWGISASPECHSVDSNVYFRLCFRQNNLGSGLGNGSLAFGMGHHRVTSS